MLIAVLPNKFLVLFIIIFGTLSFPIARYRVGTFTERRSSRRRTLIDLEVEVVFDVDLARVCLDAKQVSVLLGGVL